MLQIPSRKNLIISALVIIVLAVIVSIYFGIFQKQSKKDPFLALPLINAYTQSNFGFSFKGNLLDVSPIVLVCNDKAPKNQTETDLGQFTYCQNNGVPIKVSLAWMDSNTTFKQYLTRIANTVLKYTNKETGDYVCVEDKTFPKKNSLSGSFTDCKVTASDKSTYSYSVYFFSPPSHPEIIQVLYAYSVNGAQDETLVRNVTRDLARGIIFTE